MFPRVMNYLLGNAITLFPQLLNRFSLSFFVEFFWIHSCHSTTFRIFFVFTVCASYVIVVAGGKKW